MKKGISIWALPDRDPDACFPLAKECGYDGVEVIIAPTGPITFDSTEKELYAFRRKAESYGMPLFSMVSDTAWDYSISSGDKAVRKTAEDMTIKQLEAAAILGCDTILVVAGMVSRIAPGGEIVRYDIAYDRALESMCKFSEYAEKYDVNIGIENVGNKLLLSPLEMRDFIDKVNSPKVKAYYDVGNNIKTGYPDHWIDILGNRIAKVHFKDPSVENGLFKSNDLLCGDIDYTAVMNSLRAIGYDDWITLEHFAEEGRDIKEFLKTNLAAMNKIINEM